MEFNFDKCFKISKWCLKKLRSYPDERRNINWGLQFIVMHGIFTIIFLLVIYGIFEDVKQKDLTEACYKTTLSIFWIVVTSQYFVLVKHQKTFCNLIETMREDYILAESLPKEEQAILFSYVNKGKWVSKMWVAIGVSTGGLFIMKSVVSTISFAIAGEFKLVPIVYPITYPYFIEANKNDYGPFTAIYVMTLWYTFYTIVMYAGFMPLGLIFLTHACGQLEILKLRVQELFLDDDFSRMTINKKLKCIVKQLQCIYSFVDNIQESFELFLELIIKLLIICIPISTYQIIETYRNAGQVSLEFIFILFGCFVLSGNLCYFSDLLIQNGEALRVSVYLSGWEKHYDKGACSTVLMLMTRTIRPVAIRSMFRVISLDALTEILHQSYAIFNLLNAAYN